MIIGIGASDGIVIGKAYKYEEVELIIERQDVEHVEASLKDFDEAIATSVEQIERIKTHTEKTIDEETAAIFGAHLQILSDPELIEGVKSMIISEKVNAAYALKSVSDQFIQIFEAMDNEYIRERAADIRDVAKRLQKNLHGATASSLADISEKVIVIAKDLTPSDTAQLDKSLVDGFITNIGGRTSHSAIMARTLEIPAVVGTKDGFDQISNGDVLLLNGSTGEIIINPSKEQISNYEKQVEALRIKKDYWASFKEKETTTKDGSKLILAANIGQPEDVDQVLQYGSEGIGLYRTEFLYMDRKDFPTEEDQFLAYKTVLEQMDDKAVIIRTLDIGGDKELDYMPMEKELNPFLGNRALRLCMTKPDMFKTQLRALLRASVYGNLHIMFPMIATIDELKEAKSLVKEVEKDLLAEGIEVNDSYKIGIMIEIPAAAIIADLLIKEVDFFSIGTNDLIQYTFAADRMNECVSYLYQPFNPSLLRLIKMVSSAAVKEGKWTGMCGEMASEIKALPLLIGLGLEELSMSAPNVLRSRSMISQMSKVDCESLANKALKASNELEVLNLVDEYLETLELS